jgi:hypothetical protein
MPAAMNASLGMHERQMAIPTPATATIVVQDAMLAGRALQPYCPRACDTTYKNQDLNCGNKTTKHKCQEDNCRWGTIAKKP